MTRSLRGRWIRPLAATALTAALLAPAALRAQDPLGEPAQERVRDRERCVCFGDDGDRAGGRFLFRGERGRIGVMLGGPVEVDGQTGVRVDRVVEGGPADRAGLAAGDVLLAFDGDPLGDAPTRALLEHMGDVEAGDTVALRYSRDGRQQTARVVVEEGSGFSFMAPGAGAGAWSVPRVRGAVEPFRWRVQSDERGPAIISIDGFGQGDLELVEVNPGLGRYFDVEKGVLVTDVQEDSKLGLQPGDVIVAIGDREVRSPRHARSIIASYLPDEEITFSVVRDRRTITVQGTRER